MIFSRSLFFSAIAAVAALGVAAVCGATESKTVIATYHPTGLVGPTQGGSCWTTSIASNRPDAFRCNAGNTIYDPCFRIRASLVGCPTNAVSSRGVYLTVTSLPANGDHGNGAWAMELSNARYCTMITGTALPGYPFACGSFSMVCSSPLPATPRYTVTCGNGNGSSITSPRTYAVVHIWT